MMFPGGVLRFGERSKDYRTTFNSRPARFTHVDYTRMSAPNLLRSRLAAAGIHDLPRGRFAGYNIWRVLTPHPQDVPLGVCDARSVASGDLVPGDAVFDAPGAAEFSFEAYLVRTVRNIAGRTFPTCGPTKRWCSRPTTRIRPHRSACRIVHSRIPPVRKALRRARALKCVALLSSTTSA